jgi:hypothetical protein
MLICPLEVFMNELEFFCQLPLLDLALFVCSTVVIVALLAALIFAPRRDCFFLRWRPETRMLALLAMPALFIIWPILLYGWILRSRGVDPADPDWSDD